MTMDRAAFLNLVNDIRDMNGLEPLEGLDPEAGLRNGLGLDSLDLAELAVKIEAVTRRDVFQHPIPGTVGELVARVTGEGLATPGEG
ncbi:MAG: acyl carrier protein [Puniceicoccaceae bacterium]